MADVKLVCLLLAAFPVISLAVVTLRQAQNDGSVVYQQFHVNSDIIARYAHTQINSVVLNSATTSKELSFQVQLPETAFISNFTMTVNGTTYYGIVKGKAEAQEEFEHRQSSGENVGLVESRGTNLFQIRINTAASSQSTFTLYYEELIVRRLSRYRQVINLNPGSKVEDFRVSVRVVEQQGVTFTGASDFVGTTRQSANEVLYSYSPSLDEQTDQVFGLARDMFVEYDVVHSFNAGLIVVNDCYFAQFFSPSGVEAVPVDIIFVIDVSGSMSGNKIAQTREALETIINQLRSEDRFTMVTFESEVDTWNDRLVSVSDYNRQRGVQFARGLQAGGGTNFAGGLETAIDILKRHGDSSYVQLLVMLTDGEPTVGETNPDTIVAISLTSLAGTRISLNCLGFGVNLNFLLLQRLALSNNGIAKKIFEDSDAAQQLEGFFEEISSPILHTISITYPDNAIESISQKTFPLLFNGSEIVVAGKFSAEVCLNGQSVFVEVSGTGRESQVSYQTQVDTGSNSVVGGRSPLTERLVAYLNIQQLLDRSKIAATQQEANMTTTKALNLALRYNFVTELTSLIVVADDNFTIDDSPSGNSDGESLNGGVYLAGPAVDVGETGQGGLSVQASASAGAIAGVILLVLFILSCIVAFVVVNVAIFVYIAYTRNKRSSIPTTVGGDIHALLSMSISVEEEVDKPSSSTATPPSSPEQNGSAGEGVVKSELTAAEEKEREAMGEMDEEEERYQPAPSGGGEKEITV